MTREEREAHADRCLRRGDLAGALGAYQALAAEFPQDRALVAKLARVQESLQPAELLNPKARAPSAEPTAAFSPEQEGERLFSLGDYAGAAAAYRRALDLKPGSELIRERLVELFKLARAAPTRSPTDDALPADAEGQLRGLLDRIAARKRLRRG